jgi:hypothetical protein
MAASERSELAPERAGKAAPRSEISTARSGVLIKQSDNYAANFGEVYRSSALFWARSDASVKTTISVTNYWKYKNSLDVAVLMNLRDSSGTLVERVKIGFTDSEVFNYAPPSGFDGSVEIEAFAAKNLRIPYAAAMAIYECSDSISMVHSYARAYSQHEIEDGRTISVGEESCWTVRESAAATSFCAFHNGPAAAPAQRVELAVRRSEGEEIAAHFELPPLAPFQTVLVEPRRYIPGLVEFLGGEPGNARLSYRLQGAFTRLLCGIRALDWSQLQVTHSNFNYARHQTDFVGSERGSAYMRTPTVPDPDLRQEIVVYPDSSPGVYSLNSDALRREFQTGDIVRHRFASNAGVHLELTRKDGPLPTRIVTALRLVRDDASILPAECSLGIFHHLHPPKHFSWMVVSPARGSMICWSELSDVHGACPRDAKLVFKLYCTDAKEPIVMETTLDQMPANGAIPVRALFASKSRWPDDYAWATVWCSHGGLLFFSTLSKGRSLSIEHAF